VQAGSGERLAFLEGDGAARSLVRGWDWGATAVGPPHAWPATLQTLVQVVLGATQPMFVVWGPERSLIYNDPYIAVLAGKHPAFGRDLLDVWSEIRADLAPLAARAYAGEGTRSDGLPLLMERKGYPEQTYWTYSYTPVRDDDGAVGGFLCACQDVTDRVLADRRQAFRLRFEERLRGLDDPRAVMEAAVEELGRHLAASRAGYSEARAGGETLDFHACYVDGVAPIFGTHRLDDFGPQSMARQRRGETVATADVRADPAQVQQTWEAIDTRAFVSVPLVRDGRLRASLYVNHREPHPWTDDEVALIEEVAERTWSAVERARAEAARDRAALLGAAQNRVLELAVRDAPLPETLEAIVQTVEALSTTGVQASILLLAEDGVHLQHGAAPSLPQAYNRGIDGLAVGPANGSCGTAVHRGEPVFVSDIASDPLWADYRDLAREHGLAACWSIPIRSAQGAILGAFAMYHREPRSPEAADLDVIDFVVRTAALVIDQGRAERRLRESEERIRLATANAEVGFWDVDEVERVLHWPPIVKAMFGISADVPVSMADFYAGLHPEDAAAVGEAYAAAADPAVRAVYDVEYRTVGREDGVVRWVAAKGRGVFDEGGRCLRVTGTAVEITRRKAMESELRDLNRALARRVAETGADFERVWRNAGDVMVVIDAQGVFQRVNPATLKLLGWSEQEMLGRIVLDFVHPDDVAATLGALDHARTDALPVFENRYRTKDGSYRTIAWVAAPEAALIYAYGRDVTAERAQAEALRATEEALRQSQKMEAVGQLTGGIAHDFNNLLTGISGSLELMQTRIAQGRSAEVGRYVNAAQAAAQRAAALTHRLLAFSRRQTLDPRPLAVNRLIADMAELIRRTVGPAVEVEVVGAAGLWNTLVDPNQLENALLNLCLNARDAMPAGGRITIETANTWLDDRAAAERDTPPGQYISVCVSDTGEGMSPEVIARAFEPFFTTKPLGAGTGLGLSMIYGFARQSGGQVRIYSEVGQGTTICVYLPRHMGAVVEDVSISSRAEAQAHPGETVLVVDDEPLVRMLIVEVLEAAGYGCLEADDGASGLRVLQSDARIDLLITDVGLPGGMNGRQLADAGRALRPQLKVLFITGYAENAVVGNGHLDPRMAILTKPFAMEALASKVEDIMRR
jgi:PAS domain S-box-containing protein